jgi:hypothetical protein
MHQNAASWDRIARVLLGIGLLALVFVGPQTPYGWIGLVPLATGLAGFCPLYRLFGVSTCPVDTRRTGGRPPASAGAR